MKRKLIKQGTGSGLVTYLPKEWIEYNNLKPKDEVEVLINDNKIIIQSQKLIDEKIETLNLNVEEYTNRAISNFIFWAYRLGYSNLEIKFKNEKQLDFIEKIVKEKLLGYDITEIKDNICIIENLTEPSENKFDTILRKIFLHTKQEAKTVQTLIEQNNFEEIKQREKIKKYIDEYTNFCRRLIFKNKILNDKTASNMLVIISKLSQISHNYYYLYKELEQNIKLNKQEIKYFNQTNQFLEQYYESFYSKKHQKIAELLHKIKHSKENDFLNLIKDKNSNHLTIHYLKTIQREIEMSLTNLLGIILEENKNN